MLSCLQAELKAVPQMFFLMNQYHGCFLGRISTMISMSYILKLVNIVNCQNCLTGFNTCKYARNDRDTEWLLC